MIAPGISGITLSSEVALDCMMLAFAGWWAACIAARASGVFAELRFGSSGPLMLFFDDGRGAVVAAFEFPHAGRNVLVGCDEFAHADVCAASACRAYTVSRDSQRKPLNVDAMLLDTLPSLSPGPALLVSSPHAARDAMRVSRP